MRSPATASSSASCLSTPDRPLLLELVVEVREVHERQRRVELDVDDLRGLGDPLRRVDRRRRPPELEQRELAELGLQAVAQVAGLRVAVGDLAAVGGIHRPRRHGHVGRRVHREPPAQVRAAHVGRLPHLRRLHEPVRLLPQPHLHRVPEQPAVADRAVPARRQPGQVRALDGGGDGGRHPAERHRRAANDFSRGVRSQQLRGHRDGAQDDGLVHGIRRRTVPVRSWSGEGDYVAQRRRRRQTARPRQRDGAAAARRPRRARRRWRSRRSGARRPAPIRCCASTSQSA